MISNESFSEGNVEIVDPLNIRDQFATILESKLVAMKVSVKLLLHKGLNHVDDDNLVVLADEKKSVKEKDEANNSVTKTVGNVYEDSEVTFEFAVRSREELIKLLGQPESSNSNQANNNNYNEKGEVSAQLPFQVQVSSSCNSRSESLLYLLLIDYLHSFEWHQVRARHHQVEENHDGQSQGRRVC